MPSEFGEGFDFRAVSRPAQPPTVSGRIHEIKHGSASQHGLPLSREHLSLRGFRCWQYHTSNALELFARGGKLKGAGPGKNGQDRRDSLAEERTSLAAERTYAAWMRTGLASLAAGAGAPRLLELESPLLVNLIATVLMSFSLFCFGAAVWRELSLERDLKATEPRLPVWLLIAVSAALSLASLAATFLLWR